MCNVELKILIIKSGKKNYEINQALGWHASKLSSIMNGSYKPSSTEIEELCRILECRVEEVFPSKGKVATDA